MTFGPDLLRKRRKKKAPEVERNQEHFYMFYGQVLKGYGPSMDPHVCGDPGEACVTITSEREVGPWRVVEVLEVPDGA